MQPWVKSVLLVIVAMALVAGVGIVATPLAKPAPEQSPLRTTIADEVLEATDGAQVGEIATATVGPANQDAAADYFEARVFEAADSKSEWKIANWGPGNERVGPERFNGRGYGTKSLSQRWVVFHFSDGSALRVAEIPSVDGTTPDLWRVKSAEVTRP